MWGVFQVVERLVPPLQLLKGLEIGLTTDWGVVKKKKRWQILNSLLPPLLKPK